jgi:tripartite-type tricarboxylate transporter receptor subunit TctC
MSMTFSTLRCVLVASSAMYFGLLAWIEMSRAQEVHPSKSIQVVVTTAAGGALDLVARTTSERLSESLLQTR